MCENRAEMPALLLSWYDRHAREMPWRVPPHDRLAGVLPDPYHVWMSEIMLQQTTVAAVREYFLNFINRWPTVESLATTRDEDVMAAWAGLGYYARARNLLKCARVVVADHGGVFPSTVDALLKLPGIGPYTAAAVASIAFDQAATVLDGNVERVMARLNRVADPLPASKETLRGFAARLTPVDRPGDYAQAVMDLGATICTPKSPACGICPWMKFCAARKVGDQTDFPRKSPKARKPVRTGIVYVATCTDGSVLLERRPDKGLLGGMLGWPGSVWTEDQPVESAPFSAEWQELPEEVRHTFTHFHLRLRVHTVELEEPVSQTVGRFVPVAEYSEAALPTVMRKVWTLVSSNRM